jgi:hypothetical protein
MPATCSRRATPGAPSNQGPPTFGEYEPEPAVSFVGYRVSKLVVGDELNYAGILEAANDITLQAV